MVQRVRRFKILSTAALLVAAAALLAGCATLPAPTTGGDTSMIVGGLAFHATGIGTSPLGALGTLNSTDFSQITMKVRSAQNGMTYHLSTYEPNSLFARADLPPGRYEVVGLWGQVQTNNSWVTLTTHYTKPPTFEVPPRSVVNLGTVEWDYSFDLSGLHGTSAIAFQKDYPAVEKRLRRIYPGSPWLAYRTENATVATAGTAWVDRVRALPPRGGTSSPLIIP